MSQSATVLSITSCATNVAAIPTRSAETNEIEPASPFLKVRLGAARYINFQRKPDMSACSSTPPHNLYDVFTHNTDFFPGSIRRPPRSGMSVRLTFQTHRATLVADKLSDAAAQALLILVPDVDLRPPEIDAPRCPSLVNRALCRRSRGDSGMHFHT